MLEVSELLDSGAAFFATFFAAVFFAAAFLAGVFFAAVLVAAFFATRLVAGLGGRTSSWVLLLI
jgi:hypothetical protein